MLDLFLWSSADLPTSELSTTFESICKQQNAGNSEEELLCSSVAADIKADPYGSLGRKAGLICSQFGACDPHLVGNSSCMLKVLSPNKTVTMGSFSMCTVEGVSGGRLPPQVPIPSGKFVAHADSQQVYHSLGGGQGMLEVVSSTRIVLVCKRLTMPTAYCCR